MLPMLRGHTCSSFNQNPKNLMNDKNAKNVINDKNERQIARGARGRAAGPAADSPAGLPQAAADQGLVSRGSWVQPPPPAVLWRGRRRPLRSCPASPPWDRWVGGRRGDFLPGGGSLCGSWRWTVSLCLRPEPRAPFLSVGLVPAFPRRGVNGCLEGLSQHVGGSRRLCFHSTCQAPESDARSLLRSLRCQMS